MIRQKKNLRLFLDEGVPNSVGRQFELSDHDVIYLRDSIATGSPDELVCVAAQENEAILVACDGDMRQLVKRFGVSKSRFAKLSLIKISCPEPQAASRVKSAMSLIEHEWRVSETKVSRRLYIEIMKNVIRTNR